MKRKTILSLIFSFICVFIVSGCYYDNEEVLYPSLGQPCDTTNVTYSKSLVHTLSLYCYSCHGTTYKATGGGTKLNSYDDLKNNINLVIGAVNHGPVNNPMPKGAGKLSICLIREFEIWQEAGTPNN